MDSGIRAICVSDPLVAKEDPEGIPCSPATNQVVRHPQAADAGPCLEQFGGVVVPPRPLLLHSQAQPFQSRTHADNNT
ncbi:hypothetical protein PG997_013839 [Apiospora hydei]|uniref:Uncharacterized protein n=1 Tax=Apiospora hydei TaxID=1337664 RepID=A0ABR1V7D4_9PEZI